MPKITFTVPGNPQGKARPRFCRGHAVTPQKTRDYEALAAVLYRRASRGVSFTDGEAIRLCVYAYYPFPANAKAAEKEKMQRGELLPLKKPDLDNVVKIILDALNGVAYRDDTQVAEIHAAKHYSADPRVIVTVETVEK
jgi:Holliday junction resolvase RusA-like endonuclease